MAALVGIVAGAVLAVAVMQAKAAHDRATEPQTAQAVQAGGDVDDTLAHRREAEERRLMYARPPVVRIPTRHVVDYRLPNKYEEGGFRRIGTITGELDGKTEVLPLYSRPTMYSGRYNLHTKMLGYDGQPVAIKYRGKDCMADLGCEELFDGQEPVYLQGVTTAAFTPNLFS